MTSVDQQDLIGFGRETEDNKPAPAADAGPPLVAVSGFRVDDTPSDADRSALPRPELFGVPCWLEVDRRGFLSISTSDLASKEKPPASRIPLAPMQEQLPFGALKEMIDRREIG